MLVDFDYAIAANRIAARSTQPPENLHTFSQQLSPARPIRNRLGGRSRSFLSRLRNATGFLGDLVEFGACLPIFHADRTMIALHAELRQRGLKTYIFSNTNDLAIRHIRRNYPFFQNFDGYILSYEIKAMKPDAPIYEALEQMTDKRGDESFTLMTRAENIVGGVERGWRTILHETPEQSQSALKLLGF